jgi:hypothetical protein
MCVSLGLKKLGDFTVSEGHGYPLVYIYIYIYMALFWCQGFNSHTSEFRHYVMRNEVADFVGI